MNEQSQEYYQQNQQMQEHYQRIAENYEDLWTYSEDFVKFISRNIIEHLDLKSTDTLVDLGCGTGLFAKEINRQIDSKNPVICVDLSAKMVEQIPTNGQYQPVVMDAMDFADRAGRYDKVFIKEMIHHISDKPRLIEKLFKKISSGGIFLLILLPPTIEYPLFEKALKRYEQLQPNYKELEEILEQGGFKTEVSFVKYPLSLEKAKYFRMVENRYMSLLSTFSNEEIQQGIEEIRQKYSDESVLEFNDIFVFIKGKK